LLPVDEPSDDEGGGCEAESGVAASGASVGVAAELAVVRPPGVRRFDDPPQPESERLRFHARDLGAAPLDSEVVDAGAAETVADGAGVVAAIEVQGADVIEQTGITDGGESGFEHTHVIAIGTVDHPADPDAVTFGSDRPFPAQLRSIDGIRAGSLTSVWRFVQRRVERDVVEIETHDAIEGGERFGLERLEHTGIDLNLPGKVGGSGVQCGWASARLTVEGCGQKDASMTTENMTVLLVWSVRVGRVEPGCGRVASRDL
jgi:hypothetical protein